MSMKQKFSVLAATAMGAAMMIASVQAAKLVAPPSQQLETDENVVAIISVVGKPSDQQLKVKAEQMLHGEAFSEQVVRMDKTLVAQAKPGERYLLAFSWFTKDPLTRGKGWVKNTAGPELVGFTEVSQALFPPHPALVTLLGLSNDPDGDSVRIDCVLQLLASDDFKLRYFASLELLLNLRLPAAFTPVQRDQLQTVLASSGYAPEHRDLMYRAALQLPAALQSGWLVAQARKDLQSLGHQYDLASRVPSLARIATQVLRDHGGPTDAALLTDLLRSNAPGVAKMALHALAMKATAATEAGVAAALADKALPGESRRAFELYRKNGKLPG